ncbi:type II secretion system protein [Planctomycetota bacterium]
MQREKAFTLIELLVVITVIAALMAITIPVLNRARQAGLETACKSNLRQMGIILQNYTGDNDGCFPNPLYIYHSERSFTVTGPYSKYLECCRWHDPRIGLNSNLMQRQPELRGSLLPYISNSKLLLCKVGKRANQLNGCINPCQLPYCYHTPNMPFEVQYTYSMNGFLGTEIVTWKKIPPFDENVRKRTTRTTPVYKMTQVSRTPAQVFAFGEENSWRVTIKRLEDPNPWPPPKKRPKGGSGGSILLEKHGPNRGAIRLPALCLSSGGRLLTTVDSKDLLARDDNFATYHRPPNGDYDTGHSYAVMLDGHITKITVADQVRSSIGSIGVPSQYGAGGNLALAWPIDIPPPGGWGKQ